MEIPAPAVTKDMIPEISKRWLNDVPTSSTLAQHWANFLCAWQIREKPDEGYLIDLSWYTMCFFVLRPQMQIM